MFNNFSSRKAFFIILFVAFREFFMEPGGKFLKFRILVLIVLHLKHSRVKKCVTGIMHKNWKNIWHKTNAK